MDAFSVSPPSLVAAAAAHDDVADQLARSMSSLQGSLQGRPWGNDEPGRRFGRVPDLGTAFRPGIGYDYFLNERRQFLEAVEHR